MLGFFLCIWDLKVALPATFAPGVSVGADFPLAHRDQTDAGISLEVFYRVEPFVVRIHYARLEIDYYSVVLGRKHFFSNAMLRPYVEGALGPVIVDSPSKNLSYGVKAVGSLGADIAINSFLSTGITLRYSGYSYFGDTLSGRFEANHTFSLMGKLIVWF